MNLRLLPITALTLFALPLFSLSLLGQSSKSEAANSQTVGGITYSKQTREKKGNVKITFVSEDGKTKGEVMSSKNGSYSLKLPHARYKVTASLDGYETFNTGKGFVVLQGNDRSTFNIFMLKPGEVQKVKAAPKKQPDPAFKIVEQKSSPQVGVLVEYFKLDHRAANKLVRQYSSKAANAGELRETLGGMAEKGEAELIESGWIRSMSGQRSKSESIREDIYPTEYDAPNLSEIVSKIARAEIRKANPQEIATQQPASGRFTGNPTNFQIHMTSATPAAFETRHVGLTVEVDPVVSMNNMIDLSLSPEIVTRLEDAHFTRPGFEDKARGVDNISAATFYKTQTVTQIKAIPGNYNLLTIHTPHDEADKRIIVLVKADLFRAK